MSAAASEHRADPTELDWDQSDDGHAHRMEDRALDRFDPDRYDRDEERRIYGDDR